MKTLITILTATAILSITPLAHATILPLGSGWQTDVPGDVADIRIDGNYNQFVLIEIIKTFTQPKVDGVFEPISIDFSQTGTDAGTVAYIVLNDEIITNNTPDDWKDYHWTLEGPAAFVISASNAFDTSPFNNKEWIPDAGWGTGYASGLNVSGGMVPSGSTFSPGLDAGMLVIEIDLSGGDPATFTLTQQPTPEPATMILLAAGLPALLRRRRKRNTA